MRKHVLDFGRRFDGESLLVPWPGGHLLMSGTNGSGKSTSLNYVIAQLAGWEIIAMFGVDLKHTELTPWVNRFTVVATDHASGDQVTAMIRQIALFRQQLLTAAGERDWSPKHGPYIVFIIDEAAEYFGLDTSALNNIMASTDLTSLHEDGADKEIRALLAAARTAQTLRALNLESLGRMCRAVGIRLIVCTQYPTSAVIGPQLRAQLPYSMMHRVTRDEHVDVGLGDGWSKTIPAKAISAAEPGAFYFNDPAVARPFKGRGPHLTDDVIAERVAATAHLRFELGDLLPPHTGDPEDVEPSSGLRAVA